MTQTTPPPTTTAKPKSRTMLYAIIVIILIVVGVGVYYLTQSTSPPFTGTQISMFDNNGTCTTGSECGYRNATTTVTAGTSVRWKNEGKQDHTATSCDTSHANTQGCPTMNAAGLQAFDTGTTVKNGATSNAITFNTKGAYHYYCTLHPWMHGNLTVT